MTKSSSTKTTQIDTKTKTITKPAKAVKTTKAAKGGNESKQRLDLCLLLDCTSSMQEWIERAKNTLHEIINNVKAENEALVVRVCFVGYRDIKDTERFCVKPFTEDLDDVKAFISKVKADGGRDWPEDVQGGLQQALGQNWIPNSVKQAFLICDAPGHGVDLTNDPITDDYPGGSPDGYTVQNQMAEFAKRGIGFTVVKVNEDCNLML